MKKRILTAFCLLVLTAYISSLNAVRTDMYRVRRGPRELDEMEEVQRR